MEFDENKMVKKMTEKLDPAYEAEGPPKIFVRLHPGGYNMLTGGAKHVPDLQTLAHKAEDLQARTFHYIV